MGFADVVFQVVELEVFQLGGMKVGFGLRGDGGAGGKGLVERGEDFPVALAEGDERADRGVGRILDALDRLKLAPNTLVIFTSDNGGEWLSRNAPLFHRKNTLWEGGIRVPLLMRWPNQLGAGVTSAQVGITMDLTASIVAAAGVKPPASYRPEGIDLIAALRKGAPVERTLFWRLPPAPNATGAAALTQRAVRRGNWKYIDDRGQYLLFDLRTDSGERHDVAQQHGDLIREYRALVAKWEADVAAEVRGRVPSTQ